MSTSYTTTLARMRPMAARRNSSKMLLQRRVVRRPICRICIAWVVCKSSEYASDLCLSVLRVVWLTNTAAQLPFCQYSGLRHHSPSDMGMHTAVESARSALAFLLVFWIMADYAPAT